MTEDADDFDPLAEHIDELRRVRKEIAGLKERESIARDAILELLDGRPQAITAAGSVAVSTYQRRGIDAKKLEALFPDVHAQVVNETTVTTVKLS